ncbi:MAG: hypothetical protein AB7E79_01980 [Rhodospirillaceae bacterium]
MNLLCTRLYATALPRALGVAALLLVSGCSSSQLRAFFGPPDDESPDAGIEVARTPSASPARAVASVRPAQPFAKPVQKRARAAQPIVPAPVVSVAGLDEAEVRGVLGEPTERMERSGRRIWLYRGAGCRVEVTFFRDVTRGKYAALAHKVVRTAPGVSDKADIPCAQDRRSASR